MAIGDTEGTGTTITFATSGYSGIVLGLSIDGVSRPSIPNHSLSSTHTDKVPSSVYDSGSVTVEIEGDLNLEPPVRGASETITIQQPAKDGQTTGASLAGTGFVTGYTKGFPWGGRRTGSYTIEYESGFTVTPGS